MCNISDDILTPFSFAYNKESHFYPNQLQEQTIYTASVIPERFKSHALSHFLVSVLSNEILKIVLCMFFSGFELKQNLISMV